MTTPPTPIEQLYQALRRRFGSQIDGFRLPPPSFTSMQGEILEFDEQAATLTARFPVLESQLNPYSTLQGGFIAAAVDNTFGPLSLLVAPPSVTRRMELTYHRPATLDTGHILVRARLADRTDRHIELKADILDPHGNRLARAQSTMWIVENLPKAP